MIRIFTRQIEKLHEEDGQGLVFVALVGLVIFLFLAMAMNVAELVNTKIKNQNVADATVLSAAVWQARALNLVSGVNRNMIELYGAALLAIQLCGFAALGCDQVFCGELSIDPIICLMCLFAAAVACQGAISAGAGAVTTGAFQELLLTTVGQDILLDRDTLQGDLTQVVELNYEFKPNTQNDTVGVYMNPRPTGDQLLKAYVPGDVESDDFVLERVGLCPSLVSLFRYGNMWWHLSEGATGLSDADWDTLAPQVQSWFDVGGVCHRDVTVPGGGLEIVFPLGLRTRLANWSPQSVDSVLAITVATFKEQEPPTVLGKGSGPGDCTWVDNDSHFACPNHRHYAFASAHAFSQGASDFYGTHMADLATAYEIPYIPFEMDWEPRLFPVQEGPYFDLRDQIEDDFFEDGQMLTRNVLQLGGNNYFLY
jgi:hypothetical protein